MVPLMADHGGEVPFDATQARLLPIADAVMTSLLSRPPSGTLRSTWVSIATIALAAGVCTGALLLGVVLLGALLHQGAPWLLFELPLLAVAAAGGDLAAYGARQHWLAR
jgi:hypothetical protein